MIITLSQYELVINKICIRRNLNNLNITNPRVGSIRILGPYTFLKNRFSKTRGFMFISDNSNLPIVNLRIMVTGHHV